MERTELRSAGWRGHVRHALAVDIDLAAIAQDLDGIRRR